LLASSCPSWLPSREATLRGRHGDVWLAKAALQKASEPRMLLQQAVYQVVVLVQRNELKGRFAIDRYYYRLIATESAVSAQLSLGLTQWNDFHGR
jgi:hypothetical protein